MAQPAEHPNFWEDIYPLFTDMDIACMHVRKVLLASIDWWKKDGNFAMALAMVESGHMPKGGPRWHPDSVQKLRDWEANNFAEGPLPGTNRR